METCIQISKEGLGDQAKCTQKGNAHSCETKGEDAVDTTGIWRCQKCGIFAKKTLGSECNQTKREVMWAATNKAIRAGQSKPFEGHIWSKSVLGS